MKAYDKLVSLHRETESIARLSDLASWDQETYMPSGSVDQRAESMGVIAGLIHSRRTSPEIGELLSEIDGSELDETEAANVRLIRQDFQRRCLVPERLAVAIAETVTRSVPVWSSARSSQDVARFLPALAEVVELRREEAAALAAGGDLYDSLLQEYEHGATSEWLEGILGNGRDCLVDLRGRILSSGRQPPDFDRRFESAPQLELAKELATAFGFDWNRGRLDVSVHPFTAGAGNDVRITTRVDNGNPFDCLYSTIHEVGHAVYEQSIDPRHRLMPVGGGVSMGVHESQSRMFENQLGRSRSFAGWLHDRMQALFGDLGLSGVEDFYMSVNRVERGYIRTESDEVQYNLHILLRFDLERDLISGRMEVSDLEEAWNSRFEKDFGYPVDKPSNGMLQDIHWAAGLFGYFPTYALGNVYAGCICEAVRDNVPDLEDDLRRGDTNSVREWLVANIHGQGSLLEPRATIEKAIGGSVTDGPFLRYITEKFEEIYLR